MRYKILKEGAKITKPKEGDAGYDLYAHSYEWDSKGCCWKVYTGIALEIPKGHVGIVKDRSGQALLSVETHGGVIDESYRGEVVVFISTRDHIYGIVESLVKWAQTKSFSLTGTWFETSHAFKKPFGKFAQIIVVPCYTEDLEEVEDLSTTERNTAGFGSTGV